MLKDILPQQQVSCVTCNDQKWVRYEAQTLDGKWEQAWELCDCTSLIRVLACEDCRGYGRTISYPHFSHCFSCEGTGEVEVIVLGGRSL